MATGVSTILMTLLPETQGLEMPQTLEEGENFGKNQKFWYIPCLEPQKNKTNVKNLSNNNNKQQKDNNCGDGNYL